MLASAVGRPYVAWLDRLESEHDNLRAALAWRASEAEGADKRRRRAAALWRLAGQF